MMELNTVINRLLSDGDGRGGQRRDVSLRTFAVVPLTEVTGLLEWMPKTSTFRELVSSEQKLRGVFLDAVDLKKRYAAVADTTTSTMPTRMTTAADGKKVDDAARRRQRKLRAQVSNFRQLCDQYTPCFHRWLLRAFAAPTQWYAARLAFTRSAAAWSIVGAMTGLGDRHGENILIDTRSGECVHVDFDCLFDRGLSLECPEIVPFRLTPNFLDAFGVTGVDGVFRQTCEMTLRILRSRRSTVLSVLQTFVHDPLVDWGNADERVSSARNTLRIIERKLSGNERRSAVARVHAKLRFGVGGGDDDGIVDANTIRRTYEPLTVRGQVSMLIDEATSDTNLARMYIGWMPWL
jgi:serine/threonine-protein kinase ATR